MPKNNGKARKDWRRKRAELAQGILDPQQRLLYAIFGTHVDSGDDSKPDTDMRRNNA